LLEKHIGYVVSGRMMVKDPSGNEAEVVPGDAFEISAGSDAWVICIFQTIPAMDSVPFRPPIPFDPGH
jgi:quercetin dioxygenase-like cupin family protein